MRYTGVCAPISIRIASLWTILSPLKSHMWPVINEAVDLHRKGDFAAAEGLYSQVSSTCGLTTLMHFNS